MTLTREKLVELIAEHRQEDMYGSPEMWCECHTQLDDYLAVTHAAHLADVLEAAGYIDIREAEKRRQYAALDALEDLGSDEMPYIKPTKEG